MIVSRAQLKELRSRRNSIQQKTSRLTLQQHQSPQGSDQNYFIHNKNPKSTLQSAATQKQHANNQQIYPLNQIDQAGSNSKTLNRTLHQSRGINHQTYIANDANSQNQTIGHKINYQGQSKFIRKNSSIKKTHDRMSFDIDLSNKGINQFFVSLPNGIDYRQIYELNMSQNNIKQILPTTLVPFECLRKLNLNQNVLEKISFPYNKMKLQHLILNQNKLSNLNLQHLKHLQTVSASDNNLIFITLPESLRSLNLDKNSISNMYFIEKCVKIEKISLNFNLVYDLNFNSLSQLDKVLNKRDKSLRFPSLKNIQCTNNKICHLNSFYNICELQELNLQNNDLAMNRQNLNQLFELKKLENLNISENLSEGIYSTETALEFLISKLQKLKILNSQPTQFYLRTQDYQSDFIQTESSIDSLQNSDQKPIRLFLDQQNPKNLKLKTKDKNKMSKQNKKQWVYTLGDSQSKCSLKDGEQKICMKNATVFNKMTEQNQFSLEKKEKSGQKLPASKIKLPEKQQTNQKNYNRRQIKLLDPVKNGMSSELIHQRQKILHLQDQILAKQKLIQLPLVKYQTENYDHHLSSNKKNIVKMIFQTSFVPPEPIRNSASQTLSSRRIDQDEDEHILFSKLFENNGGIFYLRKIFLLEENDVIFQTEQKEQSQFYSLSFLAHQKINCIYKQMLTKGVLLDNALEKCGFKKSTLQLECYLTALPSAFGCYHIAVRHLIKKNSAFQKRSATPVCYLIQSKKV